MPDVTHTILDLLNADYGRKNTPGWFYLLAAIVSVGGAVAAREYAAKRKTLMASLENNLGTAELHADLISEEASGIVEYRATLWKEESKYRFHVSATNGGMTASVFEFSALSLADVEADMLRNTKFTLADFRSVNVN